MESGTAAIAVIEDNESTRRALVRQINSAGFRIVDFASAVDFLNAPERFTVDCVVADMHLPMMDGLQLQEELRRTVPYAPIVFITGHAELAIGMTAMRRGATDFLEKPVDDETLFDAIRRAVDISRDRRRTQGERAELEKKYGSLTPREREVFALITRGLLNKQVAAELGAAERTIKAHRARVMEKMGAESLADLVRNASLLGIGAASPAAAASEGGALRR